MIRLPRGRSGQGQVGFVDTLITIATASYQGAKQLTDVAGCAFGSESACDAARDDAACVKGDMDACERAAASWQSYYKELVASGEAESAEVVYVETDTKLSCLSPNRTVFFWRPSDGTLVKSMCVTSDWNGGGQFRSVQIPGVEADVWVPTDSHIYARPSDGTAAIADGSPPEWMVPIGLWGSELLYASPQAAAGTGPLAGLVKQHLQPLGEGGGAGGGSGDESGSGLGMVLGAAAVGAAIWTGYRIYNKKPVWPF